MRRYYTYCVVAAIALFFSLSSFAAVTLSGTLQYQGKKTDGTDGNFAVRGAEVEVWHIPSTATSEADYVKLVVLHTSDSGAYSVNIPSFGDSGAVVQDGDSLFIRAKPKTADAGSGTGQPTSAVQVVGHDGTDESEYVYESGVSNVATGTSSYSINKTFNSGSTSNYTDWSFAVYDSLVTQSRWHSSISGATVNTVKARFGGQSGSFYDPNDSFISLVDGDRYDWDVIDEEYNHYMQDQNNWSDSPGGSHTAQANLRWERSDLDLEEATRLAWGEGSAQFLAIYGQFQQNASALGIQNAGDSNYSDTIDQIVQYSMESSGSFPGLGEDQETSVSRILWDLYDNTNDHGGLDRVQVAFNDLYEDITASDNLSEFWTELTSGKTNKQKIDFGAIFQAHNVSAVATALDGTTIIDDAAPPTFEWDIPQGKQSSGGAQDEDLLDTFSLKFFDSTYGDLITFDLSAEGQIDEYTLTPAQWDALNDHLGLVRWVVLGGSHDFDTSIDTGLYWSDSLSFTIVPEPGTALLVLGFLGLIATKRRSHRGS